MIARADPLYHRLLNMTGKPITLLDEQGGVRFTLPSAGVVRFHNTSVRIPSNLAGFPTYEWRLRHLAGLGPPPKDPRAAGPLYVVDAFTAAILQATTKRHPTDVLTPGIAEERDGVIYIKALAWVPLDRGSPW